MSNANVDRILALIDVTLGTAPPHVVTPFTERCGRGGCEARTAPGHAYCRPCLAWLRCETDYDPLDAA